MVKQKILILEDSDDDLKTIISQMHQYYELITITEIDGFKALNKLDSESDISAVIIDLYQKDENGVEKPFGVDALKVIRDKYESHELPVLIHTTDSKANLDHCVDCLHAGAQDWIWKDAVKMNFEEKLARIRDAIKRSELQKRRIQQVETTNKTGFNRVKTYGFLMMTIACILMVVSIIQKDYIFAGLSCLILIILSISWRMLGQVNLKISAGIIDLSADLQSKNEVK